MKSKLYNGNNYYTEISFVGWLKDEEHTVVDDVAECQTVYDEKCHDEVVREDTHKKVMFLVVGPLRV